MTPLLLLRLEAAAVFVVSVAVYGSEHGGWLRLVLLFLLPDLSMIGYVRGPRIGALTYNVIHTYIGPLILGAYAVGGGHRLAGFLALIWVAHIGLDRMLGFGLKYPTRFKDTHLNPARHALSAAS